MIHTIRSLSSLSLSVSLYFSLIFIFCLLLTCIIKVEHKRTFYWLEQMILKHNAHQHCTNVKEVSGGLDFYFSHLNHCMKFIDFLQAVVPIRYKLIHSHILFHFLSLSLYFMIPLSDFLIHTHTHTHTHTLNTHTNTH
jgi:hypothetical protein